MAGLNMRKRKAVAIICVIFLIGISSWLVLSYFGVLGPDLELLVQTQQELEAVHELVGVNDYGPDVTEVHGDQIAYDLFRSLGLQRMRVWCQFGAQLAAGLGWGWYHTIFNGTSLADAQNPQFYNWTYLDLLFEVVNETGAKPILTFTGCPRSLARDGAPNKPPLDLAAYSEVVARVLMHYTQGWPGGTGHSYSFDYVEIGNEPNLSAFWNGSMSEFLNLYTVVSARLTQLGVSFKIGGPGLADINLTQWTTNVLSTVNTHGVPLDFFSWHAYWDNPAQVIHAIHTVTTLLDDNGFYDCERVFDEWGQDLSSDTQWGTMQAALHATAVLIGAADNGIDIACFSITKDTPMPPPTWILFGPEANFGLLTRNPTTAKPSFHALKPFVAITENPVLPAAINPLTLLGYFPPPLTYLVTRGAGQNNYTVLVVNHGIRSTTCRITLLGAPGGPYQIYGKELSNMSILQYNGWTPSTSLTPTSGQLSDTNIRFPPQSILWLTIEYTGLTTHNSCPPKLQLQLVVIPIIITYAKKQITLAPTS